MDVAVRRGTHGAPRTMGPLARTLGANTDVFEARMESKKCITQ
jgi:hypothetical protein